MMTTALNLNRLGIQPEYLNEFGFLKYDHYGDLYLPNNVDILPTLYMSETKILAIDCEMVGVKPYGDSALARIAIVNEYGYCIYDEFVKPNKVVVDYRTSKSGIREEDLNERGLKMDVVKNQVRGILNGKILIGHAVYNDLDALGLVHPKESLRDTACYFKTVIGGGGKDSSLKFLVEKYLKIKIQEGEHNPIVDAQATLKLYLTFREVWEASQLRLKLAGSPNDYRAINTFPRKADVHTNTKDVFLRKNKLSFTSNEEYLDIVFRLMNEDFKRQLREGVKAYLANGVNDRCNPTIRVFKDVKITKCNNKNGEVKGYIKVKIPKNKNWINFIDWEDSKSFMNGSLVLLTPNNFNTFKCGLVVHPNNEHFDAQIRNGIVEINLANEGPSWLFNPDMNFLMIESVAFFEAYYHTLQNLQSLKLELLPLRKYLVESVPKSDLVKYKFDYLNFDNLLNVSRTSSSLYGVYDTAKWPSAIEFGFNPSQYKAFQSALTSQLSIIQGPPGTGKTFIALQIIKVFLTNPELFTSPILIVAQTNHALDNVLESVLEFAQKITKCVYKGREMLLRIGGGSKSDEIYHVTEKVKAGLPERKKWLKSRIMRCREVISSATNFVNRKKAFAPIHMKESSEELSRIKEFLSESIEYEKELKKNSQDSETLKKLNVILSTIMNSFVPLKRSNPSIRWRKGKMKERLEPRMLKSNLSKPERRQLDETISQINPYLNENLQEMIKEHDGIKDIKNLDDIWAKVKVIGMTCTGAAKNKWRITQALKCEVMIVEEAAHVLEAHIVAGLTQHIKQLILIGDHQQLRPSTANHNLSKDYDLDMSLMERLVLNGKNLGVINYSQLNVQHRMSPEISRLIRPAIYKCLENHPSVKNHPDILGVTKNMYFINHKHLDERGANSTSYSNEYEASYLVKLCQYLLLQGYTEEKISIITTYVGQRTLLEKKLKEVNIGQKIRVCCVDGFQGEENDIILLSLVRSNVHNSIGFLKTDNRVNVALSRAKHGLFIIGNMSCLKSQSKTWAKINRTLVSMKAIGPGLTLKCTQHRSETQITSLAQFNLVPHGGCKKLCKQHLRCRHHVCPLYCHNFDRGHKQYKCNICPTDDLVAGMSGLNI